MFVFRIRYFVPAVVLFLIEVFIAVYVRDRFVRPYLGDYLVVIFLYCLVRAFVQAPPARVALGVWLFALAVEVLQYLQLVRRLGLQDSALANVVLGNSFEWIDLLAYTLGVLTVLWLEVRNGAARKGQAAGEGGH